MDKEKRDAIVGLLERQYAPSGFDYSIWPPEIDHDSIPGYVVIAYGAYEWRPCLDIYRWERLEVAYDLTMAEIENERVKDPEWDELDLPSVTFDWWLEFGPKEAYEISD